MVKIKRWAEEDIALLQDNLDMPIRLLAEKLGRSYGAVQLAKSNLKLHGTVRTPTQKTAAEELDNRPSGWYVEAIGVLLLEFPDAMETWLHYHRYTEIQFVEESGSWVTLRCYRDADAP